MKNNTLHSPENGYSIVIGKQVIVNTNSLRTAEPFKSLFPIRETDLDKIAEMMRNDPEAYFPEIAGDCIPEARNPRLLDEEYWGRRDMRRDIKRDPQWVNAVLTKLPLLDLSLQDAIDLEADNVIAGRALMRDMKTSREEYKEMLVMKMERTIKNDREWYEWIKKDAAKKGISVEECLHGHAQYTVNTKIANGEIIIPNDE